MFGFAHQHLSSSDNPGPSAGYYYQHHPMSVKHASAQIQQQPPLSPTPAPYGHYYASLNDHYAHMGSSQSNFGGYYSTNVAPFSPPVPTRPRLTTSIWEDQNTICYQVDARGICVARRQDNDMVNGTKLLNVAGISRGKRDGILKNEKGRVVVKVGAMHLKGVWITFARAKALAAQFNIDKVLHPLFEDDPTAYFTQHYHDNSSMISRLGSFYLASQQNHNNNTSRYSYNHSNTSASSAPTTSPPLAIHTLQRPNPRENDWLHLSDQTEINPLAYGNSSIISDSAPGTPEATMFPPHDATSSSSSSSNNVMAPYMYNSFSPPQHTSSPLSMMAYHVDQDLIDDFYYFYHHQN